jgi:hypothetical protein
MRALAFNWSLYFGSHDDFHDAVSVFFSDCSVSCTSVLVLSFASFCSFRWAPKASNLGPAD